MRRILLRLRRAASISWLLAGLAACPHNNAPPPTPKLVPPLPGNDVKLDLPNVPAKIDITTSKPTDGNAPDKRSPILDVLKGEAEREMRVLTGDKVSDPAYYLAYQLVEQRIVNLEAE